MPGSRGSAPLLHAQAKPKNEEEEESNADDDDLLSTTITPSAADDDVPNLASSEEGATVLSPAIVLSPATVLSPAKEDAINLPEENTGSYHRPRPQPLKDLQQHSEETHGSPPAAGLRSSPKTRLYANAEAYAGRPRQAEPDVSLLVSDATFDTARQRFAPGTPLTPAWLAAERSVASVPDERSHWRPAQHPLADMTASSAFDASVTLAAPWAAAHHAAAGLDGTALMSLNTTATRMDDVPPLEELEAWLASTGERLSARALTSLGAALIQHGRYEQAADLLHGVVDDVLAGVRARPQEGGLGDTLFNLGVALVGCGRMAEAAEAHRRALGCYRREEDEAGLLLAATNGTGALLAQEKYREALDVALPVLQRWELRVASRQVAASELAFGVADRTRGRGQSHSASLHDSHHASLSTSLSASLNGSLALSEAVPEDGELLCYCYIFAAQAMFKLEMPEEAAELALSALEVMPRVVAVAGPEDTGSGILEARLRHSLGAFYNAAGRFEDALPQHSAALTYYLAALDEAEAELDAARYPHGRWVGPDETAIHDASSHVATLAASAAAVADNVGFALCMVGHVESAVGELERGLALWETAGEPTLALHTHERLGSAQRLLGRDDLAAYHLEAALRIAEALYIDEAQVRLAPVLQAIWEDLAAGELGAVVAGSELVAEEPIYEVPNTDLGHDDEATASGHQRATGFFSRTGSSGPRHLPAHPRSVRFSLSTESQGDRPPPSPPQRPVSFPSTRNAHQVDVRGAKKSRAQTPQNSSPGSTVGAATANVPDDLAARAARQEARRQRRAEQAADEQRRAEEPVVAAGETEAKEAQARAERQAERDRMFPPGSYEDELNGAERLIRRVRKGMPGRTEGAESRHDNQSDDRGGSTACTIM